MNMNYPQLLTFTEKHGSFTFICRSEKELFQAALQVLKMREAQGYWYHAPEDPKLKAPSYTTAQEIEQLRGPAKEAAQKELQKYKRALKEYQEELEDWKELQEALKNQDGRLAFRILERRSDYEYEAMDLESPYLLDNPDTENLILEQLEQLSPEQRLELFQKFCLHCGSQDSGCQCWNDE